MQGIRTIFISSLLAFASLLPSTAQAEKGFFVGGGAALRRIDGTKNSTNIGPFNITAPFTTEIEVGTNSNGQRFAHTVIHNPWGYNLPDHSFKGAEIVIGYQFSERWSLCMQYTGFLQRTGSGIATWYPDSTSPPSPSRWDYLYEFHVQHHAVQIKLQRHLGVTGFIASAGFETAFQRTVIRSAWYHFDEIGFRTESYYRGVNWLSWFGPLIGLGYQKKINHSTVAVITAEYSFPAQVHGLTFVLGLRTFL
jgi:hypothetical protein